MVVGVGLQSAPDASVRRGKGGVRRGKGKAGGPVVVEDVRVCLRDGMQDRRVAERCVVLPFWKCPVDKVAGGGMCHLIPRKGCMGRNPYDASVGEFRPLREHGCCESGYAS